MADDNEKGAANAPTQDGTPAQQDTAPAQQDTAPAKPAKKTAQPVQPEPKRIDETVPGGRYIVDGKVVDATGKVLGDAE